MGVRRALTRRDPDSALRYWAVSFALQAVTTATVAHKLVGPELPALTAVGGVAAGLRAMFLGWGTLKYLQRPPAPAWVVAPAGRLWVSRLPVAARHVAARPLAHRQVCFPFRWVHLRLFQEQPVLIRLLLMLVACPLLVYGLNR